MKTFVSAFNTEKNKKTGNRPFWTMKCYFYTGTVTLTGSQLPVGSLNIVKSWGQLDEDISGMMAMARISDFEMEAIIDPAAATNIYDILTDASNSPETTKCELYLNFFNFYIWYALMGVFNILDFRKVNEVSCRIQFIDESVAKNKYLGTKLDTTAYPGMDPADVGKVGNIIYGSLAKPVPCQCIDAGGASTLTADITASSPGDSGTLVLKDASRFPASGAFIGQIEGEQISFASRSGDTLTLASSGARGYNGTTAAAHATGVSVWEVKTGYTYLRADHPVKSIGDVKVDGKLCTTGVTKYTGQTGDEHPDFPGKACIVLQHGVGVTIRKAPSGSPAGTYTSPTNAADGNEATAASTTNTSRYVEIYFAADSSIVNITSQTIHVKHTYHENGTGGWLHVYGPGGDIWSPAGISNVTNPVPASGYQDFTRVGGRPEDWIGFLTTTQVDYSNIYEVLYKEIQYYPLGTGDTAARIWIGEQVTAECEGYQDDSGGTYTGTAYARIEQPDHVFKHMLVTYAGFSASDFVTDAATPFAASSYLFAMVINEYKQLRDWFSKMAWECRCYFRFAMGKAYLSWRPDSITSDKTIAAVRANSDGTTTLQVSRSPLTELINKIDLRYDRNWVDGSYAGLYTASDASSITKYGQKEQPDLFNFDFLFPSSALIAEVADFYLDRYKDRKKVVTFDSFLDNAELEFGDAVTITEEGSLLAEIQKVNFAPGSGQEDRMDVITIVTKEY